MKLVKLVARESGNRKRKVFHFSVLFPQVFQLVVISYIIYVAHSISFEIVLHVLLIYSLYAHHLIKF